MLELGKDLVSLVFKGPYRIIALVALAIMVGAAIWLFANKTQRKKIKTLTWVCLITALLAGIAMFVQHRFYKSVNTFPNGTVGVLVLQIVGDGNNSLQRDLVESLRSELKKVSLTNGIIVRASDEQLDDTKLDLSVAHQTARSIGKRINAQLVVWGNQTGERKFWPPVTIVNETVSSFLIGERELVAQNINHFQLPEELVDEPVCLAFCIAGVSSFQCRDYESALGSFESATKFVKSDSPQIAPLRYCTATCRVYLQETQLNPKELLLDAIKEYQAAANSFASTNLSQERAMAQVGLACAYSVLAEHSRGAEGAQFLVQAIAANRMALNVFTRVKFPQGWALTQKNLSTALKQQAEHSQGEEGAKLLAEAEANLQAVLEIYARKKFPQDWADTKINMGTVLVDQAARNEGEASVQFLEHAITAFRGALEVKSRKQFPREWAMTQNDLT